MNRLNECADYVRRWYIGEPVVTIRMTAEETAEKIIQALVVELLKDFIENPIPESMAEGSQELFNWIDQAFRSSMRGIEFGLTTEEEDAVKNLAFNYWIQGIKKAQHEPGLGPRLYKCFRQEKLDS